MVTDLTGEYVQKESFLRDKGNVPGNCAIALGDMHYEPAFDAVLDRIPHCESGNALFGIL
jgi:hypothetical protein